MAMSKTENNWAIALLFLIIFTVSITAHAAENAAPQNLNYFDELRYRHSLVPEEDIWWTVTGHQMAWMHKNVHQLFPTVNVYRAGPVKNLELVPNPEINQFVISTEDGDMSFANFLESDLTTTLGMLVLHQGVIVFESYPRMKAFEKPIYWSVAKVMPALLVRLLEERGLIDVEKEIDF